MRLSSKEIDAITSAFSACLSGHAFKLYLFGSRTDDTKKGGDIDLLVVVNKEIQNKIVEQKISIRSHIFNKIDEQKIDITVATPETIMTDPFLVAIFPKCILLLEHV